MHHWKWAVDSPSTEEAIGQILLNFMAPDEIFVQLRMSIEISLCETEVMSGQFPKKNGSIQQKDICLFHCFQIPFVYVFTYILISCSKTILCFIFISFTSQIALHFCQLYPCVLLCNRRSLDASMYVRTHPHLMYWQLASECRYNFQMIISNHFSDLNKNRSY